MKNIILALSLLTMSFLFMNCGKDPTSGVNGPSDSTTCVWNSTNGSVGDGSVPCVTTSTSSMLNGASTTFRIASHLSGVAQAYDVITLVSVGAKGYFNGTPGQTTTLLHLDVNGSGSVPYRSTVLGAESITFTSALIHASSNSSAQAFEKSTITMTIN